MSTCQKKVRFIQENIPDYMNLDPYNNRAIDMVKKKLLENNYYGVYTNRYDIPDTAIQNMILVAKGLSVSRFRVENKPRLV